MATLEEIDERDQQESLRETKDQLLPLLTNTEGLLRLAQISDQAWNQAQDEDEKDEQDQAG